MSVEQFNDKYDLWKEQGHYGLAINHPILIQYLDRVFKDLVKDPTFRYSQIKTKFNMARVYLDDKHSEVASMLEEDINSILNYYNNPARA